MSDHDGHTIETDQDLIVEARTRYLTDPWFHACVDTARAVAGDASHKWGRPQDFATQTAAMALVIYADHLGDAGCTCARSPDQGGENDD